MEKGDTETSNRPGEMRRGLPRLDCSRLACSCTVKPEPYSTTPGENEKRGALLLNISAEGLCFETNFQPSVGEYMHLEIRPIEGPEVSAKIKVIHARRSAKDGFHLIGSQFDEMSESDRQNLLVLLDTIGRLEKDLS